MKLKSYNRQIDSIESNVFLVKLLYVSTRLGRRRRSPKARCSPSRELSIFSERFSTPIEKKWRKIFGPKKLSGIFFCCDKNVLITSKNIYIYKYSENFFINFLTFQKYLRYFSLFIFICLCLFAILYKIQQNSLT